MTGTIDQGFIFGCTAFDTPEISPDTYPGITIPGGANVKAGWVYQSGEMLPILQARKRTTRDPLTLIPQTLDLELLDSLGRSYAIKGTVTAVANWRTPGTISKPTFVWFVGNTTARSSTETCKNVTG
jgi:hypothetical protein